MQQLLQILVAGGDRRQQYAAQKLAESPQLSVTTIGFSQSDSETLPEFDVLVLPIHTTAESVPSKNGNLSLPELLSHVKKGGLVCGGVLPEAVCRMCLRLFSAGGTLSGKCRSNCRGSNSNCHLRTGNSTLRQLCSRHRLRQNRNNHGRAFAGLESRCHRCGSQLQRCGTLCGKWSEMDASV